jgi:FSR family fosmidomycin resistance protein-like MFS transporter
LAAIAGCLIAAAALLVPPLPILTVVIAGIGSAAFHVGAGVLCLQTTPHAATAPGLFVAPGSLGLLLGAILGKHEAMANIPLLSVALLVCLVMMHCPIVAAGPKSKTGRPACTYELVLALILLSIAGRALLGGFAGFAWEAHPVSLIALTIAAAGGKAVGGIVADRWGWMQVGVLSLLAALPFFIWGAGYPVAVILGILLLNLTMPVTLAAAVEALPGYPGFAFGLTCLALLFGAMPALLGISFSGPVLVPVVIVLSTAALYRGLRMLPVAHSFGKAVRLGK